MVSRHGTYMSWQKHCPIWAKIITNLLQTKVCRKNPRGFDRETCPLVGQTIITPSSSLVFSSTRDTEQRDIRAEL